MNVQLKELFDIIGERKTIDYSITADKLSEYGGYSFASPVAVTGEIENRAGVVTLRFKTVFTMDHTCDRCLKEFSREYIYDFEHTLVRSVQSDRDDYVVCENNTLDLDELAISDLLLQLPTKFFSGVAGRVCVSFAGRLLIPGKGTCVGGE